MMTLSENQMKLLNDFMESSIRSSKKTMNEYEELCPSLHQYFGGMCRGVEEIKELFDKFIRIRAA